MLPCKCALDFLLIEPITVQFMTVSITRHARASILMSLAGETRGYASSLLLFSNSFVRAYEKTPVRAGDEHVWVWNERMRAEHELRTRVCEVVTSACGLRERARAGNEGM